MQQFKFIFFVILINSVFAIASEPAAPTADAHGNNVKTQEKEYSGSQSDDWQQVLKDYSIAKIKYENELKTLNALKESAREKEGSLSVQELEAINKASKAVKEAEENFKRFQNQYYMRFPEKGVEKGRKYIRNDGDLGSNVDEKPHSLDSKVKILNSKINTQYKVQSKKKKKSLVNEESDVENQNKSKFDADGVTQKIKLEK